MTKADLVEEVVRAADVSKKHAETIVNTVFSSIVEALQKDDKIELQPGKELKDLINSDSSAPGAPTVVGDALSKSVGEP
jgi:integration host factor subunit beta